MNAMVEFVTGRCTNDMFCAVASSGEGIKLPVGARFVCAHCGKKLTPAVQRKRPAGLSLGLMAGGGLALSGAGLFAIGAMMGGKSAVPPLARPASVAVAPATPVVVPPVIAAAGPAEPAPAPTVIAMLPAPRVTTLTTPALKAVVPRVSAAVPAVPDAPDESAQATARAAEQAEAARQAKAKADARQAEAARVQQAAARALAQRRQDADAARTAQARQAQEDAAARARVRAEQLAAAAKARQAEQAKAAAAEQLRAQLRAQQAAAALLRAAPPAPVAAPAPVHVAAAPLPVPRGPTRGFSPRAIAGGAPLYPESSDDLGRVTVSCRIDTDGSPGGCRVLNIQGGAAFGTAVKSWLNGGNVRFAPILRNGEAVAETHQWTINFRP